MKIMRRLTTNIYMKWLNKCTIMEIRIQVHRTFM